MFRIEKMATTHFDQSPNTGRGISANFRCNLLCFRQHLLRASLDDVVNNSVCLRFLRCETVTFESNLAVKFVIADFGVQNGRKGPRPRGSKMNLGSPISN